MSLQNRRVLVVQTQDFNDEEIKTIVKGLELATKGKEFTNTTILVTKKDINFAELGNKAKEKLDEILVNNRK